jgi:hypothetical protein
MGNIVQSKENNEETAKKRLQLEAVNRLPPGLKRTEIDPDVIAEIVAKDVRQKIVELLSGKHLYHSVEISDEEIAVAARLWTPVNWEPSEKTEENRKQFAAWTMKFISTASWHFMPELPSLASNAENATVPQKRSTKDKELPTSLIMQIPHVPLVCVHCEERHPHSSGFRARIDTLPSQTLGSGVQVFVFPFQCDHCRGEPVFFMIRREGKKLQIVGRSQFEIIETPKYLPKHELHYYREAVIAYNCGRSLAGILYLRVMIEQYMRRVTGTTKRLTGEELADEYGRYLDSEFPKRFTSLKTIYTELSEKIHAGTEDAVQFAKSCDEILKHFDLLIHFPLLKEPKKALPLAPDVGPTEKESPE